MWGLWETPTPTHVLLISYNTFQLSTVIWNTMLDRQMLLQEKVSTSFPKCILVFQLFTSTHISGILS